MPDSKIYSAQTVFQGLTKTFHQYLEAQYHIWDEGLIGERRELLEKSGVTYQEPQLEATPFYVTGKPYAALSIPDAAKDILAVASAQPNTGIFREPYTHQAAALEAFLGQGEEIIVATGTGSGKTESFLMPILGFLAVESRHRPESWNRPGVRALLLYPMNALVNDQLGRLRRLLGNGEIAKTLRGSRRGRATFGMYTSRTPYPGLSSPSKDRDRVGNLLKRLYQGLSLEARERLEKEGKWPAKDIEQFVKTSFLTGDEDSELLSRHEMHRRAPDVLVTNYSMLEYMLLRPIEKSIFDQTAQWLTSDKDNRFIVVLDEAHMYRGSGGAEVAYLLRRLHSRLGITRDRVRYVLTSASLGSTEEAQRRIKLFAANLTGHRAEQRPFTLVTGDLDKKSDERAATSEEERALSEFNFASLHRVFESTEQAEASLRDLGRKVGKPIPDGPLNEEGLRNSAYSWLRAFGPAALAANLITARPHALGAIAQVVFPGGKNAERALESLLALEALVHLMDAYVLGAVPPYNALLGGKLIASLIRTREIVDAFNAKYRNAVGVISKVNKNPRLAAVTTTSALGRSSLYNRLKLDGRLLLQPIGFTSGWGHFHISDALFEELRAYLKQTGDPYASAFKYGNGPSWRLRMIRRALGLLGMDPDLIRHGFPREVFFCPIASNAIAFLKGDHKRIRYGDLPTVQHMSKLAVERWSIPRSQRFPEYSEWLAASFVAALRETGAITKTRDWGKRRGLGE